MQEQLSGLTAADAVIPNSPIVWEGLSLREFANQYIIGNPADWHKYFVVNEQGEWIGEVSVDAMKRIPTNDWWNVTVRELMQPKAQLETIRSDQPLLEVVNLLEQKKLPELVVLKENGVLIGLLEKASIVQLLQQRAEAKANPVS